ncbi:MAG: DEAD/DEAH box helicase [Chloroflexi bacterium]|nr:DEAD/DEAH box helicase [Chloroflexota bacterium]
MAAEKRDADRCLPMSGYGFTTILTGWRPSAAPSAVLRSSGNMAWLSPRDRLELQQLRLLDWLDSRDAQKGDSDPAPRPEIVEDRPDRWILTHGVQLHPWQRAAVDAWFAAGRRGTIKVVTGAGKTLVALAIAERLQAEDPELHLAVVVPTIVLMSQWYEELLARSNLPTRWIGRLGGGHQDDFSGGRRVLVAVLASAHKGLPKMIKEAQLDSHLLLIADECHRAGAPEMSRLLETPMAYSLGLSATPEREDADDAGGSAYEETKLGKALGGIVYEMTVADAVRLGVLPPFRLEHYGLPLAPDEAQRYERLTRSLSELRDALGQRSKTARKLGGEALLAWCRRIAARGQGELARLAERYVAETTRRKLLLYRAEARRVATVTLLREAFAEHPETRAILFHESLEEVERLFEALRAEGLPVVMEHSELPSGLREPSLDLFRQGLAKVVVSARTLIEGFNVPEADLGIIVASSSSTRQRIQSVGRVLRKHRGATGEEKLARICVLYVRDTADELIYEKEDWDRLLGVERNVYFHWNPPEPPREVEGPPKPYRPREEEVDVDSLREGDLYPGRYEGEEYSCDTMGNVKDATGRIAVNPQDVPERVVRVKGAYGQFRVTPRHRLVLVLTPEGGEWSVRYAGRLEEAFRFDSGGEAATALPEQLKPGDPYPGPLEPAEEYVFKQKRGGVIAKRVPRGEVYATGPQAERLVETLRSIAVEHGFVHRFYVNRLNHAFWRQGGAAYFIAALDAPLFADGGI